MGQFGQVSRFVEILYIKIRIKISMKIPIYKNQYAYNMICIKVFLKILEFHTDNYLIFKNFLHFMTFFVYIFRVSHVFFILSYITFTILYFLTYISSENMSVFPYFHQDNNKTFSEIHTYINYILIIRRIC